MPGCLRMYLSFRAKDLIVAVRAEKSEPRRMPNVRYGSLADDSAGSWGFRFIPESGHAQGVG